MKKNWLITFALVSLSAIGTYFATVSTAQQATAPQVSNYEYQVAAVLYMQKAAEYRALCYQSFNWAKMTLEMDEKNKKKLPKDERKKPRAVIVDIDETMLDNYLHKQPELRQIHRLITKIGMVGAQCEKPKRFPARLNLLTMQNPKMCEFSTFQIVTKTRNYKQPLII